MIVDNYCCKCEYWYDGHWHNAPEGTLEVPCPKCGSKDVRSYTDEGGEHYYESNAMLEYGGLDD